MNEQECQAKGGKLVDEKCEMPNVIPSTSGFKSKKKSNNPFRMWGSWVGAGIGGLYGTLATISLLIEGFSRGWYQNFIINTFNVVGESVLYVGVTLGLLTGFLIGWILTLIWRKYKR